MAQDPHLDQLTQPASRPLVRQVLHVVGIPAAVVAIDHLAFEWSQQINWSALAYAVLMPLLVGQVALLASWSAKRVHPAPMRWFVYVWSLVLVDLVVFSAMLETERDWSNPGPSTLGFALIGAQLSGLVIWLVLGSASWPWRIAAFLVLASVAAVLLGRVAVAQWRWSAYVWPAILLAQSAIVLLLCFLARVLRVRIQADYQSSPQSAQPLQFSLHHLLVWTTSVCLMLVVLRGVDLLFLERLQTQELFPLGELAVNMAAASAVAVWAALGTGPWMLRLLILAIVAAASGWGLQRTGDEWNAALGNANTDLIHIVSNMGNYSFVWTALSTGFLAALLVFFRAQGHRLTRRARAA
jgi:hypothetical protein